MNKNVIRLYKKIKNYDNSIANTLLKLSSVSASDDEWNGAGVIVVRKNGKTWEVLIMKKSNNEWDFPKGGREYGDEKKHDKTSWDNAVRELYEETGLEYDDLKWPWGKNPVHSKGIVTYLAEYVGKPKSFISDYGGSENLNIDDSNEHKGYIWLSFDDAIKLVSKYLKKQIYSAKKIVED